MSALPRLPRRGTPPPPRRRLAWDWLGSNGTQVGILIRAGALLLTSIGVTIGVLTYWGDGPATATDDGVSPRDAFVVGPLPNTPGFLVRAPRNEGLVELIDELDSQSGLPESPPHIDWESPLTQQERVALLLDLARLEDRGTVQLSARARTIIAKAKLAIGDDQGALQELLLALELDSEDTTSQDYYEFVQGRIERSRRIASASPLNPRSGLRIEGRAGTQVREPWRTTWIDERGTIHDLREASVTEAEHAAFVTRAKELFPESAPAGNEH